MRFSILVIPLVLFILALPVLVGVYVHKDAKKRGMDAVLWTAVAILVPGLIGLIVYLVVRGNRADAVCPVCERDVTPAYTRCPYCGNSLKACCGTCGMVIDPSWKLCPQCGTDITPETFAGVKPPKAKQDKGMRRLLAILIILPLLALLVGGGGLILFTLRGPVFGHAPLSSMEGYHYTAGDVAPEIQDWMEACDAQGGGVYVLHLSYEKMRQLTEFTNEESPDAYFAYVYINGYTRADGLRGSMSIQSKTMEVRYNGVARENEHLTEDYELSAFQASGKITKLKLWIDGEAVSPVASVLE